MVETQVKYIVVGHHSRCASAALLAGELGAHLLIDEGITGLTGITGALSNGLLSSLAGWWFWKTTRCLYVDSETRLRAGWLVSTATCLVFIWAPGGHRNTKCR